MELYFGKVLIRPKFDLHPIDGTPTANVFSVLAYEFRFLAASYKQN